MTPLHRLSVAGLAAAYRAGELTPERLLDRMFARIETVDAQLNALVDLDREGAYQAAAESLTYIRSGALRALEGVPVAIKANIAVRGLERAAGMEALRGSIAQEDAEAVRRLRGAGALVLGTLNMHEAALGATTDNPYYGRTRNPRDTSRTPGGSSGGSGAAVAAGLCTIALGTDTLGSVRIPAAYNGVYGLKPTNGALPNDGLVLLAERFDCIGPLARSLDDLEAACLALGLVSGEGAAPREILQLNGIGEVQPAVRRAYSQAADALCAAAVDLPHPLSAVRLAGFLLSARELAERTAGLDQDRLSEDLRRLLQLGRERGDDDVAEDERVVFETRTALRDLLAGGAMLLTPAAPQGAFPHGGRAPVTQADFTAPANIAGLPAISIPAGRDESGMPVAVQLIAAAGREADLIAAARRLDAQLGGYAPPPEPFW